MRVTGGVGGSAVMHCAHVESTGRNPGGYA